MPLGGLFCFLFPFFSFDIKKESRDFRKKNMDDWKYHRIRSIQNDQQAIRNSSVIFVAPYWSYRISCLKVQLAPLAQGADSEK